MIRITNHTMKYDYDCGPTSLSMLLSAYGVNYKPGQLIKILRSTRKDGTPWRSMKKFLESLKLFKIEEQSSISKAKLYLEKSNPLLVCWNVYGNPEYSHYSVMIQMDNEKVIILDPDDFKKFTGHDLPEFKKYWQPYRYWSVRLISINKPGKVFKEVPDSSNIPEKGKLDIPMVKDWIKKSGK